MRNPMFILRVSVLLSLVTLLLAVAVTMEVHAQEGPEVADPDVILQVDGLECGFCAENIKVSLEDLEGIADVEIDLVEQVVLVKLVEDHTITEDELEEAVTRVGYTLLDVEFVERKLGDDPAK